VFLIASRAFESYRRLQPSSCDQSMFCPALTRRSADERRHGLMVVLHDVSGKVPCE